MQTLADFELSSYGALHKFSAVTSEKIASAIGDAWVLPAANKDMSMPISPWDGLCARAASYSVHGDVGYMDHVWIT